MAKLTPKENYLRLGRGETPEYVPAFMHYKDHGPTVAHGGAFIMGVGQGEVRTGWEQPHSEWDDIWGAHYTWEKGMNAGPKPGAFILEDVTKWEGLCSRAMSSWITGHSAFASPAGNLKPSTLTVKTGTRWLRIPINHICGCP